MCIRDRCKEVYLADLLGLFLKHADELFADDLALALRLGDALQPVSYTHLDVYKRQSLLGLHALDAVAKVLSPPECFASGGNYNRSLIQIIPQAFCTAGMPQLAQRCV